MIFLDLNVSLLIGGNFFLVKVVVLPAAEIMYVSRLVLY